MKQKFADELRSSYQKGPDDRKESLGFQSRDNVNACSVAGDRENSKKFRNLEENKMRK